ncbi:MAG TPA: hypothetical protein VF534_31445 [Paraburkholderia sp.]
MQWLLPAQRTYTISEAGRGFGRGGASRCRRLEIRCGWDDQGACEWRGTVWVRAVLYNEIMLLRPEANVIEHLILGAFLVIPLLIVLFLFSDELWQEHRHLHDLHDPRPMQARARRIDWRHPLRRARHRL